jgi:predicted short-subunit dehydrogenase-like oxidoreductase (DUF2520 family)
MKDHSIAIIGLGNVGQHLGSQLRKVGWNINEVVSRNMSTALVCAKEWQSNICNSAVSLKSYIIFVCVQDRFIGEVVSQVPSGRMVLITSGSASLQRIEYDGEIGAFYPMQTFRYDQPVNWEKLPILLESMFEKTERQMFELAESLTSNVVTCRENERLHYHLAAVWVNNFTNLMIEEAQEFCEEKAISFENLKPLLKETLNKSLINNVLSNQTGPARRGDTNTISHHISVLKYPRNKLYEYLSTYIQNKFNHE